jgi:hypothetical protein
VQILFHACRGNRFAHVIVQIRTIQDDFRHGELQCESLFYLFVMQSSMAVTA